MKLIIEYIIELEWKFMDRVKNIGGRVDCQDDWRTFYIMRKSQLRGWSFEVLDSYHDDLQEAREAGRNPMTEKYGYMMAKTDPSVYATIEPYLPKLTPEKQNLIDEICKIHLLWLEELAQGYPTLIKRGRSIYSTQDSIQQTSFETYLRGELSTYSIKTLLLYKDYIDTLNSRGENLNKNILAEEVKQYGFQSLSEAERKLPRKS
ncbi:DUF4125 family protein [Eubacterium barkeri]|uniref:DUF4125 domain-containing protein n=1 Tax=Eubacterium barkeri TaxID=1528 RepID=A0A1H3AQA1_EUBBA|nr:DUF4125 family protein [Eubacterium barkeri]SDX31581.1 Protein of unknown function [Eubacterium barkeri]